MDDQNRLLELRRQIFTTGCRGGMAHLASCYSCLEILYTLYCKGVLRYDAKRPTWSDRDRLILSKGHAGLALYSVLAEAGLISWEEFHTYLQPGSHIGGEPCMRDSQWIESTTGSLGHGLSLGAGMAIALKMDRSPAKVYVLLGDGECQEGTIWEAALSAAAFRLDNLTAILDCNRIQKMDFVEKTLGCSNWQEKWASFGWAVEEMDGHNVAAIQDQLSRPNDSGRPRLVIAHTVKGKGVSIMEDAPNWHFKLPNKKEYKIFAEELALPDKEGE